MRVKDIRWKIWKNCFGNEVLTCYVKVKTMVEVTLYQKLAIWTSPSSPSNQRVQDDSLEQVYTVTMTDLNQLDEFKAEFVKKHEALYDMLTALDASPSLENNSGERNFNESIRHYFVWETRGWKYNISLLGEMPEHSMVQRFILAIGKQPLNRLSALVPRALKYQGDKNIRGITRDIEAILCQPYVPN
jgi:hypothetical protein